MAGIPFNQVHKLDFRPGEIRVDVTPDSTLGLYQSLEQNRSDSYQGTLQQGQAELKRLLSLDSAQIVSRKDQMIETERIAMDKQQQQRNQQDLQQRQKEEPERRQRAKEVAEARRQKLLDTKPGEIQQRQGGGAMDGSNVALGIAGILGVFAATGLSGEQNEERESSIEGDEDHLSDNNSTAAIDRTEASEIKFPSGPDADQLMASPNSLPSNKIDGVSVEGNEEIQNDGTSEKSLIYSDDVQVQTTVSRDTSYLNQDDDGDDWLKMMSDLMVVEEKDDQGDDGDGDVDSAASSS